MSGTSRSGLGYCDDAGCGAVGVLDDPSDVDT